jgi:hypothetical protein
MQQQFNWYVIEFNWFFPLYLPSEWVLVLSKPQVVVKLRSFRCQTCGRRRLKDGLSGICQFSSIQTMWDSCGTNGNIW